MTDPAPPQGSADLQALVSALWRAEAPRIIGALTRLVRDVGLAEELAQDALVAALEISSTHWLLRGRTRWATTCCA